MMQPSQFLRTLLVLLALLVLPACVVFTDTSAIDGAETSEDVATPDADTGDSDTEETTPSDSTPGFRNGCGGRLALLHEGAEVEPGEACGVFGEGVLSCASLETVRCVGQAAVNVCGGFGTLTVELGEPCGLCEDGVWACNEEGSASCLGAGEPNGCGGCAGLSGRPGGRCSSEAVASTWVCTSRESLVCLTESLNACGGTEALTWEGASSGPGRSCDTRCGVGDGVLVCLGEDGLECVPTSRALPANACGGCGPLPGAPGEACGVCGAGVWQCTGEGAAVCEGATAVDACGGCSGEVGRPGEECGSGRTWLCEGSTLVCTTLADETLSNVCGGASELVGSPGASCGDCGRGALVCETQNRLACAGDSPGNVCGGCDPVAGREADACGVCGSGRLECEGGSLVCVGNQGSAARNACGGCGVLGAEPGDVCGACLSWSCTSTGGLSCEVDVDQEGCGAWVTCEDLSCEDEGRRCEEGDGSSDASCGGCLAGLVGVDGVCVTPGTPVRTCGDAGCAGQNRVCVQPNPETDATCGGCLSGFEEAAGECVSPLAAPTNVTASEGTSASHVTVSWSGVTGATGYHVYRNGVRVTTTPVAGTTYNDDGAPAGGAPGAVTGLSATTTRTGDVQLTWSAAVPPVGVSASYQVRAVSGGQQSSLSLSRSGFRGAQSVTGYEVQIGNGSWVSAGNGTSWTDTNAPAGSVTVGTPTATTTLTTGVNLSVAAASTTAGATRSYRVRAVNAAGSGLQSGQVSGNRSVGTPSYQWRWSSTSGGSYTNLSGATGRTASDTGIGSGASRWYRVVVSAGGTSGATSTVVQGSRASSGGGSGSLGSVCTGDSGCPSGAWCPTNTSARRCSPRPSVGGVQMPFQWVPRGTFTLGSPEGELGRSSVEAQVEVTLTRDYFVQRSPVTQAQWEAVMTAWNALPDGQRTMIGWSDATPAFGTTPSCFRSTGTTLCTTSGSIPDSPVERVSWWDAVVYANALSILEGLTPCYTLSGCGTGTGVSGVGGGCSGTSTVCSGSGNFSCSGVSFVGKSCTGYRLLTEAEWERSARGGTSTATYGGNLSGTSGCVTLSGAGGIASGTPLADLAWYSCNSGSRTQSVGGKTPNAWGLYDMLGNVWEWTWTWYSASQSGGVDPLGPATGSFRVLRGGSWNLDAQSARAGNRNASGPGLRYNGFGFRLARTVP